MAEINTLADDGQQQKLIQQQQHRSVILNSIIAGSIAGMASCAIFHPFDVIRTKIQTGAFESFSQSVATNSTTTTTASIKPHPSNGPITMLTHTLQNGGIRALYTGLSLPLAAQAAYKATIFTTNRETKRILSERRSRTQQSQYEFTSLDYFACGASSGFVNALLFVCPVEYVRSQLIAQHSKMAQQASSTTTTGTPTVKRWNGPMDVVRTTLRKNGILGLWRGAGVTVLRDSLGCGAFFVSMELGRTHLPQLTGIPPLDDNRPAMIHTVLSGMMAGFAYWSVSMPLDSLKTLVQSGTAKSAWGAVSFLVEREGWWGARRSLYRGWQVAFGRGSPSAAVSLVTYSSVYHWITGDD